MLAGLRRGCEYRVTEDQTGRFPAEVGPVAESGQVAVPPAFYVIIGE